MWNKLRNVIVGAALFKKAGKKSARRRLSTNVDFLTADKTECMEHALSRSSLDSSHSQDTEAAHSDCKLIFYVFLHSLHQFSYNIFLFSAATKGSSVSDLPGFGSFELKAKLLRQNSIVKDQTTLSMLQSDELEQTPSNPRYFIRYSFERQCRSQVCSIRTGTAYLDYIISLVLVYYIVADANEYSLCRLFCHCQIFRN